MKKFLIILSLLLTMSISLFANDTFFYMASGQLVPTKEGEVDIEMTEEVISLVLEDKYYEVTVDFSFYNPGKKAVTLEIGFPFFCEGISGEGTISDFRCWTNDVETSYTDLPLVKEWSTSDPTELENAYVRTIKFPGKKTTKTKITYKATYGREAPSYRIAKYLYGTGSSWKNAIGKMTIRITNNMKYSYPEWKHFPEYDSLTRINDNTWEIVCTNVEPENYTDCITLIIGDIFGDNGPRVITKSSYFVCMAKQTEDSLFWYTKAQLRLLRNAVYAFHGYKFKSQDLIETFEVEAGKWGWYGRDYIDGKWVPNEYPVNKDFSEKEFTEIEKYNVNFILEEEKRR